MLGEHGWIGLALFLALMGVDASESPDAAADSAGNPELAWASRYAKMLQASLLAYLITGAFLSVAYFDLAYQLLILVIILKGVVRQQATAPWPSSSPSGDIRTRMA